MAYLSTDTTEMRNQPYIDALWSLSSEDRWWCDSDCRYWLRMEEREQEQRKLFRANRTYSPHYQAKGVFTWQQGRDCDGVKYGHVSFVACDTFEDWDKAYSDAMDWADGPESWSVIPLNEVTDARQQTYSIDTFAEAAGY